MDIEKILNYAQLDNILISIGVLLLFLVFRKLFSKYIFKFLLFLGRKAPTDFFTNVCLSFEKPVQLLFIVIGVNISVKYFPYFDHTNSFFVNISRSSIIFLIGWGFYNLSSSSSIIFKKIKEKYDIQIDDILIPFLSKALRFVIIAVSITVIAQEFDYDINGFIAGLGLGGLAFALAAQDALKNLFGGMVIITEKPFSIGDWVLTPSVEGTVEDITFRSTKIRTFAQALVTVPNATLANEAITNWSKMGKRQIKFNLRLSYETPTEKIETVVKRINDLLKNHSGVHKETIFVVFDKYMENGLDVFLYFFTNTTVWGEYLKVREDINIKIMKILEEEDVHIALPTRKLYVDK